MEAKTNTAEKHQYTYNLDDIKERLVELRTGANKNGKKERASHSRLWQIK